MMDFGSLFLHHNAYVVSTKAKPKARNWRSAAS